MPETNMRGIVATIEKYSRSRRRKRASTRLRSLAFVVIGLVVTGAAALLFSRYAISPAQGIISAVKDSLSGQPTFDMTPQTISGKYAAFDYPRGLTALQSHPNAGTALAAYNWKRQDIQTWRLAISIIDVPSYRMTDNNAYLFRKMNPARFSESIQVIDGTAVPIMTDTTAEGFSQVGFLRHGRYQAVVSLYGDDQRGLDQLQATLAMVLHSWRWLQG